MGPLKSVRNVSPKPGLSLTRTTLSTLGFSFNMDKEAWGWYQIIECIQTPAAKETWHTTCGPSQYLISGARQLWMPRQSDLRRAPHNEEKKTLGLEQCRCQSASVRGEAIPNNTSECWVFEISILLVSLLWLRRYSSADKFVRGTERKWNDAHFFLFHKDLFEVAIRYL